jgi:hypothetical protein
MERLTVGIELLTTLTYGASDPSVNLPHCLFLKDVFYKHKYRVRKINY